MVLAYPDTVDAKFAEHWDTWFNQPEVDALVSAGINTVRIPLGYWIVEQLVDRKTEFFARGGMKHLRRGLEQLRKAGIDVILDHHGLPGVQSPNQQFTGRCTSDVQFYTAKNYQRALTWTAVMTTLSHIDPAFATVTQIQAVNEPIMDANQTPGYGDFQKSFVLTMRIVEAILGIFQFPSSLSVTAELLFLESDIQTAFSKVCDDTKVKSKFPKEVIQAVFDALPIVLEISRDLSYDVSFLHFDGRKPNRKPLISNFMDVNWQYNNPSNPADAALGPQDYDNHLYYVFGGVADPVPEAYLIHICNLDRVQNDAAKGNSPLFFGEWGLPTQFEATDEFLSKWADAQKMAYSKGAGWIFWNFKVEPGPNDREWSYLDGLRRGYFTKDPSAYHDPHVCDPYVGKTFTPSTTSTSTTSSGTNTAVTATTTGTASQSIATASNGATVSVSGTSQATPTTVSTSSQPTATVSSTGSQATATTDTTTTTTTD
ncbi:hypothetical protein V5O48_005233 [Marasmius crinis-equi]|uniref:Glycoside hydrolase family 5 protein n=1 Tax=Marasmius crinis-equi TaxID=585013 RepID=A0ABR3FNK3_9AGAR